MWPRRQPVRLPGRLTTLMREHAGEAVKLPLTCAMVDLADILGQLPQLPRTRPLMFLRDAMPRVPPTIGMLWGDDYLLNPPSPTLSFASWTTPWGIPPPPPSSPITNTSWMRQDGLCFPVLQAPGSVRG